jgi:glycosyltransferase involved in cell wall biosynthesis
MYRQIIAQPFINKNFVTAIPNAIPINQFFKPDQRELCRQELGLSPENFVIGFAGRMEKVKRIDLLLKSFQQILPKYPKTRLVLVGEGSNKAEWEKLAESLGISQAVIWTGFRTDMARILAALDIYVLPSENEGLSLSILEAMAAGKAVIATEAGAAQEVLTDQKTGILVPRGSPSAIGDAILDLLNHPDKCTTLAQAARDHVRQLFDVQRMVDGYKRVYEELAS